MALNTNFLMQQAIQLATQAAQAGEVPVGAVLANASGEIVATARNQVEADKNPLAHAEMLVLQQALVGHPEKFLEDHTLAVTLEPCAMCMAALIHARVGTVVFGAYDVKSGGTVNGARVPAHSHFKPQILGGIEEQTCRELLQDFFKNLRM
jgi:tRNA(Arg) A34 adenosine deaminase TadA